MTPWNLVYGKEPFREHAAHIFSVEEKIKVVRSHEMLVPSNRLRGVKLQKTTFCMKFHRQ